MKKKFNFKNKKWIIILMGMLLNFPVHAQTITENISLSFGKIVLVNNSSVKQVTLLPSGSYTAHPDYIFFTDPRLANVTVDGYTPNSTLNVTMGTANLNSSGGGANFSFGNSFTSPPIIQTDASGSATFDIGATLSSDGSGLGFSDDDYTGTYIITITQ